MADLLVWDAAELLKYRGPILSSPGILREVLPGGNEDLGHGQAYELEEKRRTRILEIQRGREIFLRSSASQQEWRASRKNLLTRISNQSCRSDLVGGNREDGERPPDQRTG